MPNHHNEPFLYFTDPDLCTHGPQRRVHVIPSLGTRDGASAGGADILRRRKVSFCTLSRLDLPHFAA